MVRRSVCAPVGDYITITFMTDSCEWEWPSSSCYQVKYLSLQDAADVDQGLLYCQNSSAPLLLFPLWTPPKKLSLTKLHSDPSSCWEGGRLRESKSDEEGGCQLLTMNRINVSDWIHLIIVIVKKKDICFVAQTLSLHLESIKVWSVHTSKELTSHCINVCYPSAAGLVCK